MIFLPLVFLLVFGVLGAIFLVIALVSRQKAQTSQSWPTAAGTVLAAELKEHVSHDYDDTPSTRYSFEPVVEYSYAVGAQTFTSRRIGYGANRFSRSQAQKTVERYPVGSAVTVHYNPTNPTEAVLETQASGSMLFLILGIIFLALCLMSGCGTVAVALLEK